MLVQNLESQSEWNSSVREDVASCGHVCQPSGCAMLWKRISKTWCLIMSGVETLKGRFPSTLTLGISSFQSFLRTSGNSLAWKVIFDKRKKTSWLEPAHVERENITSMNYKSFTRCFPKMQKSEKKHEASANPRRRREGRKRRSFSMTAHWAAPWPRIDLVIQ